MGVIYRRGQRVMGSLVLRESTPWSATYQLTGGVSGDATARGGLFYLHTDHLDTVQVITDQNQRIVWKGQQKPFGETEAIIELVDNPLRFPGQYFDRETGLHYNYFRDYDPKVGRYIESDPLGLKDGLNVYAYVSSNPLIFSDPNGSQRLSVPHLDSSNKAIKVITDFLKARDWGDAGRTAGKLCSLMCEERNVSPGDLIALDIKADNCNKIITDALEGDPAGPLHPLVYERLFRECVSSCECPKSCEQ
jgi:RHS repeat-associated protein